MLAGEPVYAWIDLPAAAALAAEVLDGVDVPEDVQQAVQRAGHALVAAAGLQTPTDEAKAACSAFLPFYEGILAAIPYRRLLTAQAATRAAWARACSAN